MIWNEVDCTLSLIMTFSIWFVILHCTFCLSDGTSTIFDGSVNDESSVTSAGHNSDSCARIPHLTTHAFQKSFKGRSPVIFSSSSYQNSTFKARVTRDSLLFSFADAPIVLASSNSNSYDKRNSRFVDYVLSTVDVPIAPNTSALDIWYMFGDTPMMGDSRWANLMSSYEMPMDANEDDGLPTFGIGGLNSGVAFHTHGAAFGETIIGKKKWFLSPPARRPNFNSNNSQLDWSLLMQDKNQDVITCIVGEGEVIYIPPNWWHATLNLANWNSFMSTFTREKMSLLT